MSSILIGDATHVLELRLATERFDAIIECSHYTWVLYAYDAFWRYGIGGCDSITWPSVGGRHGECALLSLRILSMCRQYFKFRRLTRCF